MDTTIGSIRLHHSVNLVCIVGPFVMAIVASLVAHPKQKSRMNDKNKIIIGGIPIEIVDQDRINEESDKGMFFVCMRVSHGPPGIPNSRQMECDYCDEKVWMSPATYSSWQPSGATIVCMECCAKRVEAEQKESP